MSSSKHEERMMKVIASSLSGLISITLVYILQAKDVCLSHRHCNGCHHFIKQKQNCDIEAWLFPADCIELTKENWKGKNLKLGR